MEKLSQPKTYGEYVCTHLLGATAEGAVYKAHQPATPDRAFALRTLQLPVDNFDQVLQECNAHMVEVKALQAPNIVPILDYGNVDNEYYVVMPYIEGESLQTLLKRADKTPESMPSFHEILTLAEALAEALNGIHDAGLTHGAIEPHNILITKDKSIYLADVGLTRLIKITFSLSSTGSFWTGEYTAPEVWDGERNTPASDQYSLACVMYHLVTGRAPFYAKTIFEMMKQHQSTVITPPHYIRKDSPFELTMFFLTSTAKNPPERYRSIEELISEFRLSIENETPQTTDFFLIEATDNSPDTD